MRAHCLPVAKDWYEVLPISGGISLIREKHVASWMRCNIWYIRGRDRDLLIDSGMGLRPIKAEVARLAERPVVAISSHAHFDHIGCSAEFEIRLGHRAEAAIHENPDNDSTCANAWIGGQLLTALPREGYELKTFAITPAPLTGYLDEGDVVDTGDRAFQVLHVPGHSPGSIALYELKTGILFSGDIVYNGAFIDNAWHSNTDDYRCSLERLRSLPLTLIHAGHEGSFGPDRLEELIQRYLKGENRLEDITTWMEAQRSTS